MNKIVLIAFLAFSLATQSLALCAPPDNDYILAAVARPNGNVRVYDTDLDNDRRGFEFLPGTSESLGRGALADERHFAEHYLDFSFIRRPLFEIYKVLRI